MRHARPSAGAGEPSPSTRGSSGSTEVALTHGRSAGRRVVVALGRRAVVATAADLDERRARAWPPPRAPLRAAGGSSRRGRGRFVGSRTVGANHVLAPRECLHRVLQCLAWVERPARRAGWRRRCPTAAWQPRKIRRDDDKSHVPVRRAVPPLTARRFCGRRPRSSRRRGSARPSVESYLADAYFAGTLTDCEARNAPGAPHSLSVNQASSARTTASDWSARTGTFQYPRERTSRGRAGGGARAACPSPLRPCGVRTTCGLPA